MTPESLIWLIVCALSAILFFGIAAVVTFKGVADLRDLLRDRKSM